jgi:hypothetical protein
VWTLGLSYDSFEEGIGFALDELNSKLGLQWNITAALRLRVAWFETVKPALIVDQTLEPTQIAGFNQFFDDFNGTQARRQGVGLDAHVTRHLDAGVEASWRDLEAPIFDRGTIAIARIEDQEEKLYRAYLYWAPSFNWTVSAEYQFENFEREPNRDIGLPLHLKTVSAPVSVRYFDRSGFFAVLRASYIRQELRRGAGSTLPAGVDDFALFDTALGYRLSNRRGILSVEASNLFDRKFLFRDANFQTSEAANPRFIPDRMLLVRLTLNF